MNNRDSTRTQTFTYDALNRITSGYSAAATGTYSWGETYSIDPWGNLNIAPMGGKAHGGAFANASNNNNQALGLSYDAAGNVTNYLNAYVYDPENRIQSAAGTIYTYDADGQRVLKSNSSGTPTKRYWMSGGNILAEGDGSGNLTAEYVFFGGKRLVRIDLPSNTVHYYLSDHLGSTSKVVNAAGVAEEESDFTPYGSELTVAQGTNHYKFTDKERDTETQLDYFGARYYTNLAGRFITPDWAPKAAAVPYAEFADPQSLNLYTYVRNVPTSKVDPDGHEQKPTSWSNNTPQCASPGGYCGTSSNFTFTSAAVNMQTDTVSVSTDHTVKTMNQDGSTTVSSTTTQVSFSTKQGEEGKVVSSTTQTSTYNFDKDGKQVSKSEGAVKNISIGEAAKSISGGSMLLSQVQQSAHASGLGAFARQLWDNKWTVGGHSAAAVGFSACLIGEPCGALVGGAAIAEGLFATGEAVHDYNKEEKK